MNTGNPLMVNVVDPFRDYAQGSEPDRGSPGS